MDEAAVRALLESVRAGGQSVEGAFERLRALPFEDVGFAKIDHHRALRCGFPEVIYCEGKTTDQVVTIFGRCAAGGGNVLATRASEAVFDAIAKEHAGSPLRRRVHQRHTEDQAIARLSNFDSAMSGRAHDAPTPRRAA